MRKILLDFNVTRTQEMVQDYLALSMDFPEHYGKNLDALYDLLTELAEDTCVGIFAPGEEHPAYRYLQKVKRVFHDAELENPHLCVIFSVLEDNYEEGEIFGL